MCGVSMTYVISMLDDIFVFPASILAAQGPSESDFCISMTYVISMLDDISFFRRMLSLHKGRARAFFTLH